VALKGIQFQSKKIIVGGMPWRTYVAAEWADHVSDRTGTSLLNQGVFVITLRWGKVTEFHVYCDTQKLEKNLAVLVSQGVSEAGQEPIQDNLGLQWRVV
jgi:ketosteroid isomerase-like protein